MKKLIIVCDDKTQIYANYLRQLISSNDDTDEGIVGTKDGEVEVSVWLEKHYEANSLTISSNQYILFIGENKISKKEIINMKIEFDKFGMEYGWLGKRAMMNVKQVLKEKEYNDFVEFCKNYGLEYDSLVKTSKKVNDKKEGENNGFFSSLFDNNSKVDNEIQDNKNTNNEKKVKNNKNYSRLLKVAGVVGASVLFGAPGTVAAVGIMGFKAFQNNKIKDMQYKVLTVIMYIDGLVKFLKN